MGFLDNTGVTRLVTDLKSRFAAFTHTHAATDITSGTLPVAQGGTGASNATTARQNLGTPASSSLATVESSTATANHAKGSHFIVDGELKKATSAIASGEAITSSNSTTDTLQGQIDTLQDLVIYYDSAAVTAANGFTITGNATRNGIVTTLNFRVVVNSNVTTRQFIIGTLKPSVCPSAFISTVVQQSNGNSQFVSVDIRTNGELLITVPNVSGSIYSPSGANIWLRAIYMSC